MSAQRIRFIGLGKMGAPMAARLLEREIALELADADPDAVDAIVASYPGLASPAGECWAGTDIVILMLPGSPIIESVVGGAGALEGLDAGATIVDMSSAEPGSTVSLAAKAAAKGVRFVDAPVSGGVLRAKDGTLAIMVGGFSSDVADVSRLFEPLGTMMHVGPVGSGHAAKALNNLVSATTLAITAEAILAGEAFGIEPATMTQVLNSSSGRSNSSEVKMPKFILPETFDSGFALSLMAKDLRIAASLLPQVSAHGSVATSAIELWNAADSEYEPAADHTLIFEFLTRQQGRDDEQG
ncbi:NAD(P)-dependent oxidoreductase [Salinibacterium sp. M195]|uniref:NAD(P)-dependent oxidoreductase n=1 Tax=Salinibacterium sp. M195 TaxID=2583374 RepID=UPI001C63A147|nr:NAD(P)-dependent oxidoreductase [Salinibacterium sp. M195]QYH35463.1 NAD(P)-dependent oxidoreductase [Salinibacterium sp. M195]